MGSFWASPAWTQMGLWAFRLTHWLLRLPVWPFTVPRVKVVIVAEGQVLLIKQWFSDGRWELPGGGMESGETAFQAARREVDEEVGLELGELQEKGLYRPAGRAAVWQLMYAPHDKASLLLVTRPYEILAAKWVPLTEVSNDSIDGLTRDVIASVVADFPDRARHGSDQE